RRAVLQGGRAALRRPARGRPGEGVRGKCLRGREAAGEGEDVGPFGDLEDLANRRRLDARHPPRQLDHGIASLRRFGPAAPSGRGSTVVSFTVASTMVVVVRVTPAMRRRVPERRASSVSVFRETTLSTYESSPATRWHSRTPGICWIRRANASW